MLTAVKCGDALAGSHTADYVIGSSHVNEICHIIIKKAPLNRGVFYQISYKANVTEQRRCWISRMNKAPLLDVYIHATLPRYPPARRGRNNGIWKEISSFNFLIVDSILYTYFLEEIQLYCCPSSPWRFPVTANGPRLGYTFLFPVCSLFVLFLLSHVACLRFPDSGYTTCQA